MRAEDIATALRGKRAGRQFACLCPAHDDHSPSLIVFDGKSSVQVRCMAGCSNEQVIAALRKRGIWQGGGRPIVPLAHEPSSQSVMDDVPLLPADHRELALDIFSRGDEVNGTAAEAYLRSRNIPVPKRSFNFMRFVRWCPKGRGRVPALVALMRTVADDAPAAIQRVFLDGAENSSIPRENLGSPHSSRPPQKTGAMMLGPSANAVMKLGMEREPFARVYVCEGLETGLALVGAGYGPVWALGSAGAMERFPAINVGRLIICADNDRPGMEAATAARHRYGANAVVWKPKREGLDFADILRLREIVKTGGP
jgi:putative DNA primase/helicase